MGNQASKVIEKTKERRGNKTRRKSTATVGGGRSHSSLSISHASSSNSHGNYDWVEPSSGSGAIDAAMAAAGMADVRKPAPPMMTAAGGDNDTTSTTTTTPTLTPRRKSVSEILARRKGSFSRISTSQEDFREYDRLQRQHYLLKSARKSNTVAPIKNPKIILDLGSAGGIWALEMAATFPDTEVIGIDIQPPPLQQNAPKNLKFIESNIYEKFPLADASVDLVFQRGMGHIIRKDKWPHVLEEILRVLKPGGYVELVEADLWHHNPGPVQQAFDAFMQEQCSEYGLDFVFTESLSAMIETAGFTDVSHTSLDIPIGEWPKDPELKQYGFINKETQKAYLRNRKQFYVSAWGIAPEDYDVAVQEVMDEFEEYHGFSRFNSWVARKPAAED